MTAEQYVVIVDRCAGNETVGEMWKETKIFDGSATLEEVVDWAQKPSRDFIDSTSVERLPTRCNIILTRADV